MAESGPLGSDAAAPPAEATIDVASAEAGAGRLSEPDPDPEPRLEPHGDPLIDTVASEPTPSGLSGTDAPAEPAALPPGPAAPDATRRGPGFGALLGTGLLGGLIGAGALYAADTWWKPQASGLDPRVARLEASVRTLAPSDTVQALDRKANEVGSALAGLNERLRTTQDLAEKNAAALQNLPSPPSAPAAAPPDPGALADLTARLAALEGQMREQGQAAGAIQALRDEMQANGAAVQGQLRDLEARLREQLDGERRGQLQDLEARLRQAGAAAVQGLERKLSDQDQRIAALARQASDQGPATASLRVVLADRVAAAVRGGSPYADGLAALKRLGVEPARVQPLEPFAQTGAPTAAALAHDFQPLGAQIIEETRAASPTSPTWSDRLWRMVDRIVTVRPVGEATSNSPRGLVARIEDALRRGALRDAATAWDALPEPARRISDGWGQRLKGRIAAEDAAQRLSAEALSALESSTRSRS